MYLFLLAQILIYANISTLQVMYLTFILKIYFHYLCVCAHIVFSGDGAADGWEPVDVSAGNQTVLGKSNKFS